MSLSLADNLKKAKKLLKSSEITVVNEDGSEYKERRTSDGYFKRIDEKASSSTEGNETISKKKQKKVERLKRMGFIVDLKPDLQLASMENGIFLGSQDVAADLNILRAEGITHIINCATGISNFFPTKFRYYKLEILDLPNEDLRKHFYGLNMYMKECVDAGGKVLVHCNAGISRSSTIVISYMMRFDHLSVQEALEKVKSVRPVARPNDGFMQQLLMYEDDLLLERQLQQSS